MAPRLFSAASSETTLEVYFCPTLAFGCPADGFPPDREVDG
jgi:hypothetical protein